MRTILLKSAAALTLGCALAAAPALAQSQSDSMQGTTTNEGTTTNQGTTGTTTDQGTTGATTGAETGATQVGTAGVEASNLIGTNVRNTNGDTIGEVGDLVLDGNGDAQGVVVDVGGFLGIGARSVLVSWDSLTITRADNGSVEVTTALSREQLEGLQPYETSGSMLD